MSKELVRKSLELVTEEPQKQSRTTSSKRRKQRRRACKIGKTASQKKSEAVEDMLQQNAAILMQRNKCTNSGRVVAKIMENRTPSWKRSAQAQPKENASDNEIPDEAYDISDVLL